MFYSVIIPVYNRPGEVDELLRSLTLQQFAGFEVVVVEDGSTVTCREVVAKYKGCLDITYLDQPNSGPAQARNYGAARSRGDCLIFFDSDCLVPEGYFDTVEKELRDSECDAFGGPDRAHPSFTTIQKAISYSMTSFFTTGGIRGGKRKMDKFYPRSFNMGIRKSVFETLGGFSAMRFGEDIDLSIRIFEGGYSCRLFPHAWVYHKRRTDFRKFFRQVYNSGIARVNLWKMHPGSLKPVHLLPATFTVGTGLLVAGSLFFPWLLAPVLLYVLLVFADASVRYRNPVTGFQSVIAAFVQLSGYGLGFLVAWWKRCVRGKGEFSAFDRTFYK